jgi:hypothetical protein
MNRFFILNEKLFFFIITIISCICINSCKLSDAVTVPSTTTVTTKSVRYVANMVSSSSSVNPVITYTAVNGGTTQIQQMSLDITQSMTIGTKAALTGSCDGYYSNIGFQSSAAVDLKIYVNDTLKAQANDLKTDPLIKVTASANCSYTIK